METNTCYSKVSTFDLVNTFCILKCLYSDLKTQYYTTDSEKMPILVKDYTWIQTSKNINIRIPLDPVYREKVDIFTAESYIKIHFSPYLLELFLLHDVNTKQSKCVVRDDIIIIDLVKLREINWDCLEKFLSKEDKKIKRQQILEESQEKAKKEAEEKNIRKSELDRFTVQKAMDIDTRQHALMDSRRDEERRKAMNDLENWRMQTFKQNEFGKDKILKNSKQSVKIVELPNSDDESQNKIHNSSNNNLTQRCPVKSVGQNEFDKDKILKNSKQSVKIVELPNSDDESQNKIHNSSNNNLTQRCPVKSVGQNEFGKDKILKNSKQSVKIVELPNSDDESQNKIHNSSNNNLTQRCPVKSVGQNEFGKDKILKNSKQSVKIVELPNSDDESQNKIHNSFNNNLTQPCPVKSVVKSEYIDKKKKEEAKRILPKMRKTMQVEITHTPRTFPTPSRESTAQEEEAWLKNITLARRATGFVSEDLRPEEQDPQWCKEKGDEFFRCGNFLGAISAYTHGITLSEKLPSLYSNRAAAHFALGNFNKCANDSSSALDLMKPACEGNRHSRAKCIARRAAALARMGYLNKAIDEMKAASKLLPEDDKIKNDIFDMERAWEQNPDSD